MRNRDIANIVASNNLEEQIFQAGTNSLAHAYNIGMDNQRIDSVHIKSNMRRLGRIGISSESIHKFLINLKRHYSNHYATVDEKIAARYLSEKSMGCFSRVKPDGLVKNQNLKIEQRRFKGLYNKKSDSRTFYEFVIFNHPR